MEAFLLLVEVESFLSFPSQSFQSNFQILLYYMVLNIPEETIKTSTTS